MKDQDWVGRLVEFRENKTLIQSACGCFFENEITSACGAWIGRIYEVFRGQDGCLYAWADTRFRKTIPTITGIKNNRRYVKVIRSHRERKVSLTYKRKRLIRLKGSRWKPVIR